MKLVLPSLLAAIALATLASCVSADGPRFREIAPPAATESKLVIYRLDELGCGAQPIQVREAASQREVLLHLHGYCELALQHDSAKLSGEVLFRGIKPGAYIDLHSTKAVPLKKGGVSFVRVSPLIIPGVTSQRQISNSGLITTTEYTIYEKAKSGLNFQIVPEQQALQDLRACRDEGHARP